MAWATSDGDSEVADCDLVEKLKQMADPMNVSRWKHKWRFHNRGVVWDTTLMANLGREGSDGVHKILHPPKKNDVIVALLKLMKLPAKHLLKGNQRRTQQRKQGIWTRWSLILRDRARGSSGKSGATATRWWTGSLARQGKGRWEVLLRRSKSYREGGGAGASIFDGGWTTTLCRSFVSTTKKQMRGSKRRSHKFDGRNERGVA